MDRNQVFDKLEGLRGALIRMFIIVAVFSVVSFFFWKDALHFLQKPLGLPLIMYSLPEAFLTSLRLSLFMGIFLAAPFIFNGLWGALSPLLPSFPPRYSFMIVLSATVLFYGGTFFCYFLVLPVGINFLVTYGSESLKPMIGLSKYLTFSIGLSFAFGVIFELPLIMLILGRVGTDRISGSGPEPQICPPGQLDSFGHPDPHPGCLHHAPDDGSDANPLRGIHLAGQDLREKEGPGA